MTSFRRTPQWGTLEPPLQRLRHRLCVPRIVSCNGRRWAIGKCRYPGKIVAHTINRMRRQHRRVKILHPPKNLVSIVAYRERLSACWVSSNRYLYCVVIIIIIMAKELYKFNDQFFVWNMTKFNICMWALLNMYCIRNIQRIGRRFTALLLHNNLFFILRTLCLLVFQWSISGQD